MLEMAVPVVCVSGACGVLVIGNCEAGFSQGWNVIRD